MDKILTWFKTDEARLRITVYIAWNYICFSILCITNMSKTVLTLLPLFSSALVYSVYSVSGPFTECAGRVSKKLPYCSFPFITVPCLLLAWPAEKISSRLNKNFSFYGKGMNFYNLNMIHEGINQLENVKTSKYDSRGATECWTALADLYYEDQQYSRAIETYYKALNYSPENLLIFTKLGRCYFMISDYEPAAGFFMKVISESEETLDCDVLTARCRNKMNDYEKELSKLNIFCLNWKRTSWKNSKDKNCGTNVCDIPIETASIVGQKSCSRLPVISYREALLILITIVAGFSYHYKKHDTTETPTIPAPANSFTPDNYLRSNSRAAVIMRNKGKHTPKLVKGRRLYRVKKQLENYKKIQRTSLLQQRHPIETLKFE